MWYLILTIHYVICIFLIIVVLLQSGKAADLAGAFGGMGSQTVFGPRGSATVLSKATTIAASLFMITSLSLSIIATRGGAGSTPSLLDKATKPAATKQAAPPPGQTAPITVTPIQGGKAGEPQNIQVPVVPAPAGAQPQQAPPAK
ncbi:MAG: preprotein translocase subunit SecG [Bryobacterales bacterium]|nr:preprotein translocase subunit SecG [Bryobacterales bacterium]MBV9399682.1 preprotein translocase subunit SecG [Bryobacterales bacterium]